MPTLPSICGPTSGQLCPGTVALGTPPPPDRHMHNGVISMSLREQGWRKALNPRWLQEYAGEPGIAPGHTGDKMDPLALLMALALSPSFDTSYRRNGQSVSTPPKPWHWRSSNDPRNQQKCLPAGCPFPLYNISLFVHFPQSQDSSA